VHGSLQPQFFAVLEHPDSVQISSVHALLSLQSAGEQLPLCADPLRENAKMLDTINAPSKISFNLTSKFIFSRFIKPTLQ